jgi:hypothetical protein
MSGPEMSYQLNEAYMTEISDGTDMYYVTGEVSDLYSYVRLDDVISSYEAKEDEESKGAIVMTRGDSEKYKFQPVASSFQGFVNSVDLNAFESLDDLPKPLDVIEQEYNMEMMRQNQYRKGPLDPSWKLAKHCEQDGSRIQPVESKDCDKHYFSIWTQYADMTGLCFLDLELKGNSGARWYFECVIQSDSSSFAVGIGRKSSYVHSK